jgi:hypothetical protein
LLMCKQLLQFLSNLDHFLLSDLPKKLLLTRPRKKFHRLYSLTQSSRNNLNKVRLLKWHHHQLNLLLSLKPLLSTKKEKLQLLN